jgi:hypothetical protein
MAFATGQAIDDVLVPGELEAIEVYRTRSELPREFAGIDQCGAIVFWTRFGGYDRSGTVHIVAAAAGLLGMLAFLIRLGVGR